MAEEPPKATSGVTTARATSFVHQNAPKKPPPKPLLPPAAISPVIRFSRWAALIAGVTYGVYHNRNLVKKEARLHEIEEKHRAAREPGIAREKAIKTRAEMLTLAQQVGVAVPADFEVNFAIPDAKNSAGNKH